jgi:hypothetical protein
VKDIIICDVDGTLCTDEHRNHILQQPCPDCHGAGYKIPEDGTTKCRACWGSGCKRGSAEWDEYFSLCHLDPPVQAVIEVLKVFRGMSNVSSEMKVASLDKTYKIHLMTARVDTVARKTLQWLLENNVPYDSIRFRPADSRLQDNVLKTKWADELGGPERVLFVLEDRQRVVDAWRLAGYTCFQVAKGDF